MEVVDTGACLCTDSDCTSCSTLYHEAVLRYGLVAQQLDGTTSTYQNVGWGARLGGGVGGRAGEWVGR